MRRSPKVWIWTSVTTMLFFLIGFLTPRLLHLDSTEKLVLRGAVWFLGLIASILVFVWASSKWKATPREAGDADDIDITMAAARRRLAEARGKAAARFGKLPLMVVVGPAGSAKTTIVSRSGMEPELLAGEVLRGDSIMATAAVNVWYAQDNLVLEAGGPVAADPNRWKKLVRQLRPNRLAAALARGRQAPRVVVVCFGCDELLKPGASESVPAAAQKLRARLAEMSQRIGIRLPVYVLFTKADRLPYFDDYVRSLTREEAHDALGATLTVPPAGAPAGVYAEREARRLGEAFNVLFRGLAGRRLELLQRETQDDIKAGVYEFPREFRKIADLATQFLLDLCRPSQLGVSPFLRGFYFTGVRPVYIHDVGADEPRAAPASSGAQAIDATGVFDPRMLQQKAAPPRPSPGSRKVPEWTFLDRVFRDVLLRDKVARGVTGGGTRVNFLRRAMLASAGVLALILSLGFTWSFFRNRGLLGESSEAIEGARLLAAGSPLPDLDLFQKLDTLRQSAATLDRYSREGAPWRMRWFLYAGNRVQPEVRRLYFRRFGDMQWQRTRAALVAYLQNLPDSVTEASAYNETYNALRAYIATSSRPDRASSVFLTPTLMEYWTIGIQPDAERLDLARAQFDFFGDELPYGHPYTTGGDSVLVADARRFLSGFTGTEQLYPVLLDFASDSVEPVRWPGSVIRNDAVVPAAFTRAGWERAQEMLADVPRLFDREDWVLGESAVAVDDRSQLATELRERYTGEYIDHWQRFLSAGSVPRFTNATDAAARLEPLSKSDSPLLRMLGIVADNTAVDTTEVGVAFRPVLDVVPANSDELSGTAGEYLSTLVAMQQAFAAVGNATGALQQQALGEARSSVQQVKSQVANLQNSFSTQGEAWETGQAVAALLRMPATVAENVVNTAPAAAVNESGPTFCAPFSRILSQFPFNPSASTDASLDDVRAALDPTNGALWTFYRDQFSDLLVQQGNRYVAARGAAVEVTQAFVDFFNRSAQVSRAMFAQDGSVRVPFTLSIDAGFDVVLVSVTLADRTVTFTRANSSAQGFIWTGSTTGARIQAQLEGPARTVVDIPAGPWSVFRLFHQAQHTQLGGATYRVTWQIPDSNATLTGQVTYDAGVPIFDPGYFGGLRSCPRQIAR